MRIITCASYFGTGSSAVTDYFSEYQDVSSLGRFEFRFIQDPNGIADLEYNIVENNHRHNTSEAIKRYLKMTKNFKSFGYGGGYKVFGKNFDRLTERYIAEITQLKTKSWWYMNRVERGNLFCILDRAYSFAKRMATGGLHNEHRYSLLSKTEMAYFSAISEEEFLKATRKYIRSLFASVNKEKTNFMMVDQLVPATNTERYLRYFDDVRIIVTERDPRDVYLSERERYLWGVVPARSVEEYVEWFKITRKYSRPEKEDTTRVYRLQFEDLIYNYEETTKKLAEFVGLPQEYHIRPFSKFDPKKSIKNTNLKKQIKGYEEDIAYIEEHLKEYLFDFEAYEKKSSGILK